MTAGDAFREARDFLLRHRTDYATAVRDFRWPQLEQFNWALDHFDRLAEEHAGPALWRLDAEGREERYSFAELRQASNRTANFLRAQGVRRGERILVMLGNEVALWETLLGAFKLGAVVVPATTLLSDADLQDRVQRGRIAHLVVGSAHTERCASLDAGLTRICVGAPVAGWQPYAPAACASDFLPDGPTLATDPLLLYFTSGTTSRPKLVLHSHSSYPVGHLSTLYWIGLQPGDVHLNISSPGWAKHAWSCVFAPWNAGACVFIHDVPRFKPQALLEVLARYPVTSLCAPPTVWRMLIQEDLAAYRERLQLRELVGAGEPLDRKSVV